MLNRISFNGDAAALHSLAAYFDKLDKALAEMHQLLHKEQSPLPIFVKEGSKIIRLPREEIMYIEGYGDYVKIHRSGGKPLLSQSSLKYFEEHLDNSLFCRVHRSYIVSLVQISYIEHKRIRIGNELIPISESYLPSLMNHNPKGIRGSTPFIPKKGNFGYKKPPFAEKNRHFVNFICT